MKKITNKLKYEYRFLKSKVREKSKSKKRSSKWDETRDLFLSSNQLCAACGSNKRLQVHHIKPFHLFPESELDLNNLITLCMSENECHLNLGHCDNFSKFNPQIREHAKLFSISNVGQRKILLEHVKYAKHS